MIYFAHVKDKTPPESLQSDTGSFWCRLFARGQFLRVLQNVRGAEYKSRLSVSVLQLVGFYLTHIKYFL